MRFFVLNHGVLQWYLNEKVNATKIEKFNFFNDKYSF